MGGEGGRGATGKEGEYGRLLETKKSVQCPLFSLFRFVAPAPRRYRSRYHASSVPSPSLVGRRREDSFGASKKKVRRLFPNVRRRSAAILHLSRLSQKLPGERAGPRQLPFVAPSSFPPAESLLLRSPFVSMLATLLPTYYRRHQAPLVPT